MTILSRTYGCNRCAVEMDHEEPKYVAAKVGDKDFFQHVYDFHLCPECWTAVYEFANTSPKIPQPRTKTGKFASPRITREQVSDAKKYRKNLSNGGLFIEGEGRK